MEESFLYNSDKDKENKWLPAVDLEIVNVTDKVDTVTVEKANAMPQWKGYSPCKILSLGQKIKLHTHKHIKVVLGKKWLQKAAHIRKMRAF